MNHKHLKYPNLAIFFAILFITFVLYRTGTLQEIVHSFGKLEYLGAFFAGMFFVSTFTVAPATAMLILFSHDLNLVLLALLAGLGAVVGDYTIFRFVEDELVSELKQIFNRVGGDNFLKAHRIIHTEYFAWIWPVIGAILIASPLPDEIGIGILGIYRLSIGKFVLLSFILNTVGIFILLSAARALAG